MNRSMVMKPVFYITTPIYYVNDEPHLGHAYTTVLTDVLARYARLQGMDTFFLTGVDEHGQKVFNAVRKSNMEDAQNYVDRMAERFKAVWKYLNISYDDFIRTTDLRHERVVQSVLQDLWDRGEIYLGAYEGWYCVPDERFWTEKDLHDGLCPDCGRPTEKIIEQNYFFKMSKYQDWLVEYLITHPDFILPAHRQSEVLGFLRQPLGDLCISRPTFRLNWGIRLPFAPGYVTYVWFDALLNYITAAGYLQDMGKFNRFWPNVIHFIGKDILTTHSVYWLTMLKAMNLPMPKNIFAHGWWSIKGKKMGKSIGNAINPFLLANTYGIDAFRYFLMRDMTPGLDSDFDEKRLYTRYTSDLSNTLGNLVHRVVHMTHRYFGGILPGPQIETVEDEAMRRRTVELPKKVFAHIENYLVQQALVEIMDILTAANGYLEKTMPWKLAKSGDLDRVATIIYTTSEVLRITGILLSPVMPSLSRELFQRLGWLPNDEIKLDMTWGVLQPGNRMVMAAPLFPGVEILDSGKDK